MKLPKPRNWNKPPKDLAQPYPGVFTFNLFSLPECDAILDRVKPLRHKAPPPNSMNKYGVTLFGAWARGMGKYLVHKYVQPISREFYPDINPLKRHSYQFVVDYALDTQRSLAAHHDSAHVTLNVCLGHDWTGGDLVFYDEAGKPACTIEHSIGQAVVHRASHVHRAKPLTSGTRSNLILWCEQKAR